VSLAMWLALGGDSSLVVGVILVRVVTVVLGGFYFLMDLVHI
jgi:hypothetical protein